MDLEQIYARMLGHRAMLRRYRLGQPGHIGPRKNAAIMLIAEYQLHAVSGRANLQNGYIARYGGRSPTEAESPALGARTPHPQRVR